MDSRIAQHMSACKYKQLWDQMRVHCARVSADGSVRATVASNRHTTGFMHLHTHPHLLCGYCGEVLFSGGITSAAPLQYPQCTGVTPHQAWGDIRCGTLRSKALLNTYVDGTNTGVRERSPVQSHVALHHIHQHSALSSRALGPSLQTVLVCAKHQ